MVQINWIPNVINFWPSIIVAGCFIFALGGFVVTVYKYKSYIRHDQKWKDYITAEVARQSVVIQAIAEKTPGVDKSLIEKFMNKELIEMPRTSNPAYNKPAVLQRYFIELGLEPKFKPDKEEKLKNT